MEEESSLLRSNSPSREKGSHRSLFDPLVGVVNSSEQQRLKKLIFRASRGKAFVQFFNLQEKVYDYYGH